MHEFTLKDPRKMGERDPKYGQSYWCYAHESNMPVKFNLMDGDVHDGDKISCEEYTVRKSSKGTEYQQLRKVKVAGQTVVSGSTNPQPAKKEWQPRDDDRIVAQWAIGQATKYFEGDDFKTAQPEDYATFIANVEGLAREFFSMVERVKNPKAKSAEVKVQPEEDAVVEDFDDRDPINLDDIPF